MSQVDEVRAAADIVRIVGDYVKLRKAGANYMGLCPFHQEKTPSFAVHPTKQIFHCFGCGVGGDVFKFVMMMENLSFPEALRRVAEKVGGRIRETADAAMVLARFVGPDKSEGMSTFLVEKGTPGFTIGHQLRKMGIRSWDTVNLRFEDCRIPDATHIRGNFKKTLTVFND